MDWIRLLALALLAVRCVVGIQPGSGVMVLPLERRIGWHSAAGRRLLGAAAHMNLHDDLLTKGYYTSRVSIGTPAHEFALIVDTGSSVTYVPCSSCTHCGNHQDPRFSPSSSSSYKTLQCGNECSSGTCQGNRCMYKRTYAELSSSSGILGRDLMFFSNSSSSSGGLGSQELVFGCETSETGDLYDQSADGIMGLGRGSLSIVDQLVEKKAMDDVFSLCYGGMSFGGGAMALGALPPTPGMVFTRSDPNRSPYYNIMLKGLRVAGAPLDLKPEVFNAGHGTVLDSGTTYAYFPHAAFQAFTQAVKHQVEEALHEVAGPDPNFKDICYAGAGTDISKLSHFFPSLDLVFENGESVALTPENYLFRHTKISGAYCLGVFKNADASTLLGGITVRNMLVSYDRAKERIGFLKTNCTDLWNTFSEHSQHSQQPSQFLNPPPSSPPASPAPAPELSNGSTAVEISMLLAINYTTFRGLTIKFVDDLVRDLGVDLNQVSISNFTAVGTDNITVTLIIVPTNTTVERIISRLEHHEVHLAEVFGMYIVTSFRVVPMHTQIDERKQKKMVLESRVLIAAACIAALVSGVGAVAYWQVKAKHRKHTYQTLDESNATNENEEQQPLQVEDGVQLQRF